MATAKAVKSGYRLLGAIIEPRQLSASWVEERRRKTAIK